MNWRLWRKEQKFEAFVGYIGGLESGSTGLMLRALNLANDLGLQGKKVEAIQRRNSLTGDPTLNSIWFVGTVQK